MKLRIFHLLVFSLAVFTLSAQNKPDLRYNDNGEFKIVQFTDLHYKFGKSASDAAINCIKTVLLEEEPDLVIITGDMVYSKHVNESIEIICEVFQQFEVPFACVFGNHDFQFDMTRPQMYDKYSSYSYNVQPERDSLVDSPDYLIQIKSSDRSSQSISTVLYCFDTHSSSRFKGWKGYDWIHFDQIHDYLECHTLLKNLPATANANALAFMHIPLPEYAFAADDPSTSVYGNFGEDVCCPPVNSGLFTAFLEAGNVCAVFAGHDHDNDYTVLYKGILLAYGRYSGGNTVYNNLKPNGARVILLRESGDCNTWIRLSDGTVCQELQFYFKPVK